MLNSCNFIGRLTKDPELRESPSGMKLVNFSIAQTESKKDKDGNKIEKTEYIKCVAFDSKANYIGNYMHKGDLVFINSRCQTREFNDKNGVKKSETNFLVIDIKSLNNKHREQAAEQVSEQPTKQADTDIFEDSEIPF